MITALVRRELGPSKQAVYTKTLIPAEVVGPIGGQADDADWFTEDDDRLMDAPWTNAERAWFAGIALTLIFFGFLIGKAF